MPDPALNLCRSGDAVAALRPSGLAVRHAGEAESRSAGDGV